MLNHALASHGCVCCSLLATMAATDVCFMLSKAFLISMRIHKSKPQSLAILAILLIVVSSSLACLPERANWWTGGCCCRMWLHLCSKSCAMVLSMALLSVIGRVSFHLDGCAVLGSRTVMS